MDWISWNTQCHDRRSNLPQLHRSPKGQSCKGYVWTLVKGVIISEVKKVYMGWLICQHLSAVSGCHGSVLVLSLNAYPQMFWTRVELHEKVYEGFFEHGSSTKKNISNFWKGFFFYWLAETYVLTHCFSLRQRFFPNQIADKMFLCNKWESLTLKVLLWLKIICGCCPEDF